MQQEEVGTRGETRSVERERCILGDMVDTGNVADVNGFEGHCGCGERNGREGENEAEEEERIQLELSNLLWGKEAETRGIYAPTRAESRCWNIRLPNSVLCVWIFFFPLPIFSPIYIHY